MKSKFSKVVSATYIKIYIIVVALNVLFFPTFQKYTSEGYNRFSISVNGVYVGVTDDESKIFDYYREAKRIIALQSDDMVFTKFPEISYDAEEVIYGEIDADESIINNMVDVIAKSKVSTLSHAYAIKVDDTIVNVSSAQAVEDILQQAVDEYDMQGKFDVVLSNDETRELNVLAASIVKNENMAVEEETSGIAVAGFAQEFTFSEEELLLESPEEGFDSFEYGIESMELSKTVEIVEEYIPSSQITETMVAADGLLNEQEQQQIYKVQAGDTLSEISITVNLPLDEIIALNDSLENEYSIINIDQELIITVPEPALTVIWTEVAKLEESYNLPIEYVYNDEWYTTKSETLQQPSAGYHEAVLNIIHNGDNVVDKTTMYEEVINEPIAKIIEVGTIVPPTFIKPLAGGRISCGFGYRNAPTAGASSYHQGIDYYTPLGSSVYAACGGTVVRAGWSGGYGYCVDIQHANGVLTRYGHLSRIFVSVGQTVNQGECIAASGSTGVSTGPHLHFEIRFNGVAVNPLNYLQ